MWEEYQFSHAILIKKVNKDVFPRHLSLPYIWNKPLSIHWHKKHTTRRRFTPQNHRVHEIHLQAYFSVISDYWTTLKISAMYLLHLRKWRNDVSIVQGYKVHILIYCFRYCPINKVQIWIRWKVCTSISNFWLTDPSAMHKWALYFGCRLLYTSSGETFTLHVIVFSFNSKLFLKSGHME